MKSRSILLAALGLVSSTVLAQSVQPVPEPAPGSTPETEATSPPPGADQMPVPSMETGTVTPSVSEEAGTLSSGAPGAQTTQSGGGGQLITPEIAQSRPAADTTEIGIEPQTSNGVTYLCGGIGEDEAGYMKQAAAKDYDLMMTFAEKSGNYVADVNVSIKDARGNTVLETKCDAPILLVDLPTSGNYRIHADAGGRGLDRSASARTGKGRAKQITFVWPNSAAVESKESGSPGAKSSGSDSYSGTESSGSDSGYDTEGSGSENGIEEYPGDNIR